MRKELPAVELFQALPHLLSKPGIVVKVVLDKLLNILFRAAAVLSRDPIELVLQGRSEMDFHYFQRRDSKAKCQGGLSPTKMTDPNTRLLQRANSWDDPAMGGSSRAEDLGTLAGAGRMRASRLRTWVARFAVWPIIFFALSVTADAQFKEVGPPPFSPTVARQKIRTSLDRVDPSNRHETIDTLNGLVPWYRDILDEELIAAWQKDGRANLTQVIEPLADARLASAIIDYSWRQAAQATFNLTYAPMFGHLMERYPDSAKPFLTDLLAPAANGQQTLNLSPPEAEAVCRILLDMPDIGTWKKSALQILPHYRLVAERLLAQDVQGADQEKSYRAQLWQRELRGDVPGIANQPPSPRGKPAVSPPPVAGRAPAGNQNQAPTLAQRNAIDRAPTPSAANSAAAQPPPPSAPIPSAPPSLYWGARSGTLQSSGGPIPQNAEYVFRNLPLVKMQLDYDTKIWEARLVPGEGQTQRLLVRNISSGPQKRCVVRWSIVP
ncbi:MAG: hypothetical protein ACLQU1_43775 [Bryobacteraceae bacterium]